MKKISENNEWLSKSGMVPQWQPIELLSFIGSKIDEILNYTNEQYQSLFSTQFKPDVLDDVTLDRVFRFYSEQEEYIGIYGEQLIRWKKENLNSNQEAEIARIFKQVKSLEVVNNNILALAHELKGGCIDRILEIDNELGLKILTGSVSLSRSLN